MDISVPSRFACLKIEDDDNRPTSNNSVNSKKKPEGKQIKKVNSAKKGSVPLQKVPSTTNSNKPQPLSRNKKNKQTERQWEDWKKKDSELVDDNFEQDMQNAILQSKLEFEACSKKTHNNTTIQNGEKNKQQQQQQQQQQPATNSKKKKNKTMNLAEFLEGNDNKNQRNSSSKDKEDKVTEEDYFERMLEVAKKEVTKGRVEEQRKEREINFEKIITLAQCQEKLRLEQERNAELQKKLDEARAEVAAVKERNKMFCSILGQGEMKDKAGILLELERLNVVKDELTEEVARLHKLLEQERSKTVNDSQSSKHKEKEKSKK